MGDQVVAHVAAECEDVEPSRSTIGLGLFEGAPGAVGIAGRVGMMRAGKRPGVVAIEIVPCAPRSRRMAADRACRYARRAARRAAAPLRRLRGQPAPRGKAAKNLLPVSGRPRPAIMSTSAMRALAIRLMRGWIACTTTPRRSSAEATFAGAPDQVRSSRGLPNTEVIATRSKRGCRKLLVTASRGSVVSMNASRHRLRSARQ